MSCEDSWGNSIAILLTMDEHFGMQSVFHLKTSNLLDWEALSNRLLERGWMQFLDIIG